jgi:myo-inositol-1(or 4)-monophosphatase
MKDFISQCLKDAGQVLLEHLARGCPAQLKENQSSVVTAADLASEKLIVARIRGAFPEDGIIAEETGCQAGRSSRTWVIDPLDGTSNFAASLPWFGVMIAVLEQGTPVAGGMYLPVTDTLYFAEKGRGSARDGQPIALTKEARLSQVLCACCMDASSDPAENQRQAAALGRLVNHARNVRATNSLVDVCYTVDGRLGGFVNYCTKIWDIAVPALAFREAGGVFTDLDGRDVVFRPDAEPFDRNYAVVGASPALHPQILAALHGNR